MAKININITSVRAANSNLPSIKSNVNYVKNSINSVRCNIQQEVSARMNIVNALNSLYYDSQKIESAIQDVYVSVNKCTDIYTQADDSVKKKSQYIDDWK